jgi:HEAT repeat protein
MRQKHRYRLITALTARMPSPIWVICVMHHNLSGFLNLTDPLAVQQFIYTASIDDDLFHAIKQGLLDLGEAALPALYRALQDEDTGIRRQVIMTLCHARGQPEVFVHLAPLATDPDPAIRQALARHSGQLYDPRVIDMLLTLLRDSVPEVRADAAHSLTYIGRAFPQARILQALDELQANDEHDLVRSQARFAHNDLCQWMRTYT